MERYADESHINIGCCEDVSMAELAALIADVIGFKGKLRYATDKPDGMPRKLLDVSILESVGWSPVVST